MKLFHAPNSSSQPVYIMINELGLKCEILPVDFANRTELLKFNPRGQVPTLVLDNGQVLTETAVIMQYLADLKPEMNFLPKAGTWERYKAIESVNFVATELHRGLGMMFNKEIPETAKTIMKTDLLKRFDFLNTHLGKNQFLAANQYTIADAYCFAVVNWTKWVGIDMAQYPNILGHSERIGTRPAVMTTIKSDAKVDMTKTDMTV